jgi:N-acetylmuramoyl-L-alanine amidase
LLVAGLGACAPQPPSRPPEAGREALYAGRPQLAGLDTGPLRGRRILIDPGHGGRFAGVEGVASTREADVNLGVGLYLWGLLRDAGADVHLTRASDRDLLADSTRTLRDDLAARVAQLDSLRPEVFLSLHHNSNAALDRERNAIETYYKLDDDGPSFDLARAIHAQLVRHLGIADTRLVPGNYFVLRGARTAAVLGEASYLSNPDVEAKLRLAEKQKLEAEAYFLGLLDYFRRGAPLLVRLPPAGDTLEAGADLRFGFEDGSGAGLDPLSVRAWVDGRPAAAHVDAPGSQLRLPAARLAAGRRAVRVEARNLRGHAARTWSDTLVVHAPAAELRLVQEPDPAAPGSELRLRVEVRDAHGAPVGDGLQVGLRGQDLDLLEAEAATRDGCVLARARLRGSAPRLEMQAGSARAEVGVQVRAGAAAARFARCRDGRDGRPVDEAWARGCDLQVDGDRAGYLWLPAGCDSLRVERRGYVPWRGRLPADGRIDLEPLFGGRLHGVTWVLDPAGDGTQPDAQAHHDVCRLLADQLRAAGSRALLTRGVSDEVSDLERVRLATREHADWYVRVDGGPSWAVLHYPGSRDGERLARSLAAALERRLGSRVEVRSDTQRLLQQTPCPAVTVVQPDVAAAAAAAPDPARARRRAHALQAGLRALLDPQAAQLAPLVGVVHPAPPDAVVLLDAAIAVPLEADGRFVFDAVAPGRRTLLVQSAAGSAEIEVVTSGTDTTRVRLALPATRP